jgi:hypothetical protein
MFKSFLVCYWGDGWVESILTREELGGPLSFRELEYTVESIPGEELI